MKPAFYLIFAITCIGVLTGRLAEAPLNGQLDYIFKPLLMPLLAIYFYWQTSQKMTSFTKLVLVGLFFAWLGDLFLMFAGIDKGDKLFFLLGLGGFLIMQIFYSIAYTKTPKSKHPYSLVKDKFYLTLPFFAIAIGFYIWAFPSLGLVLKIAVLIYALALTSMVIFSMNRYRRVSDPSFWLVFIGASSFMISDLLIGVNKFIMEFSGAGFIIMLTYVLAQFLIIEGCLIQYKEKH